MVQQETIVTGCSPPTTWASWPRVERLPSDEEARAFVAGVEPGEASEEVFWRCERADEPRRMLACALALQRAGSPRAATLLETAAKKALDREDLDFAWKVLLGLL